MRIRCVAVLGLMVLAPLASAEAPQVAPMRALAKSDVKGWVETPTVIDAIKAQNVQNANIDSAKIDALDKKWRAETNSSSRPLIDSVLAKPLSAYLRKVKADSKGLYTEIFVMDD